MPKKRTRGPTLTLADLTFHEQFVLAGGWWRPGCRGAAETRWRSWREYFDAYAIVRPALLAARTRRWAPFAEIAWPMFEADPARFDPDAATAALNEAREATRAQSGGRKAVGS